MSEQSSDNARGRRRFSGLLIGLWIAVSLVGATVTGRAALAGPSESKLAWACLFFSLSCAASLVSLVTDWKLLGRSNRLRSTSISWGVPLKKPSWIPAGQVFFGTSICSLVSALVSLAGFPRAALVLWFLGAGLFSMAILGALERRAQMTFEHDGLLIQRDGLRFLIPWGAIERVESIGPGQYQMVGIRVTDLTTVLDSTEPKSPASRVRVESIFGREARLVLTPWSGGLDGDTLVRYLGEAVRG